MRRQIETRQKGTNNNNNSTEMAKNGGGGDDDFESFSCTDEEDEGDQTSLDSSR